MYLNIKNNNMQITRINQKLTFRHKAQSFILILCTILLGFSSCDKDDPVVEPIPIGQPDSYFLAAVGASGVSGTIKFQELDNNATQIDITLSGTSSGNMHPAHVHANTAAEGGGIIISLNPVDGATGTSSTVVTSLDDGTALSFDQVMDLNAYVNVHNSMDDLGTLLAQGDIGQNILTGNSKTYPLNEKDVTGISGTVLLQERANGKSLATITLAGTPADGMHPSHIHANTAAEGGAILVSLSPVVGATGISKTTIRTLDDGSEVSYSQLETINGYINVHLSAAELGTIVAQGDIGQNSLTNTSKTYTLNERAVAGISGTIKFTKRVNGNALAEINISGTPSDGTHPAHIHANTAAEGGAIVVSLSPVVGATGSSATNIAADDAGAVLSYDDVIALDAYVNVHLSADELGTIVAQGDIGGNELTGMSTTYTLDERDITGISGTVKFEERVSGLTLATIALQNTPDGAMHPAHIHANTAAEGGGILVTFTPVDGTSGMSATTIRTLADGSALTYEDIIVMDGYVNVHESAANLGSLAAQGDIGINVLTGESKMYTLKEKDSPGIMGTLLLEKRMSGLTLATLDIENTSAGVLSPAHIHANSAVETGAILVTFTPVNGNDGISQTTIRSLDNATAITYDELLDIDGYVNVHLSAAALGTIIAQGDIGGNELTGDNQTYTLNTKDAVGVSGNVLFEKRKNGTALATISLEGTVIGGDHPAHIHANTAAMGGGILVSLNNVDGETGKSQTNITQLDDMTALSYDDILTINGYINVHLSASMLGTIIAQGDIGANAN